MISVAIDKQWPQQLAQGLAAMQCTLSAEQQQALLAYLGLLARWNRSYNLTAVRDPALMVRRQLLDSLSILPWVERGPVLDIGTGAGLPGLPLAIARPQLTFSLLDTNGKKTRFVQQAVAELGLPNVEVIRQRVEQLHRPAYYRCIVSRAFASLAAMAPLSAPLLAADGCWLAMKGPSVEAELAELVELGDDIRAELCDLQVPGEPAGRKLVILHPAPPSAIADTSHRTG